MQIPYVDRSMLSSAINIHGRAGVASLYPERLELSNKLDKIRRGQERFNTITGIIAGGIDVASAAYKLVSDVNLMKGSREIDEGLRAIQVRVREADENGEIRPVEYEYQDEDGVTQKGVRWEMPEAIRMEYQSMQDGIKRKYGITAEVAAQLETKFRNGYYQVEQYVQDQGYARTQKDRQDTLAKDLTDWTRQAVNGEISDDELAARAKGATAYMTPDRQEIVAGQAVRTAGYQRAVNAAQAEADTKGLQAGYAMIDRNPDYTDEEKAQARVSIAKKYEENLAAFYAQSDAQLKDAMEKTEKGVVTEQAREKILEDVPEGYRAAVEEKLYKKQADMAHSAAMKMYGDQIAAGKSDSDAAKAVVAALKDKEGGLGTKYAGPKTSAPSEQYGLDMAYFQRQADSGGSGSKDKAVLAEFFRMAGAYVAGADGITYGMVVTYARENMTSLEMAEGYADFTQKWGYKLPPGAKVAFDRAMDLAKRSESRLNEEEWKTLQMDIFMATLNYVKDAGSGARTPEAVEAFATRQLQSAIGLRIRDKDWNPEQAVSMTASMRGLRSFSYGGKRGQSFIQYISDTATGKYDPVYTDPDNPEAGAIFMSPQDRDRMTAAANILGTNLAYALGGSPSDTAVSEEKIAIAKRYGKKLDEDITAPRWGTYFEPAAGGEDISGALVFQDKRTGLEYTYKPDGKNGLQLFERVQGKKAWSPSKKGGVSGPGVLEKIMSGLDMVELFKDVGIGGIGR